MDESNSTPASGQDEITADYANNIGIESTVWDVKAIFGEYSERSKSVGWHTSITMPWATAKLLAYYLEVNLAFHEIYNGSVSIPEFAIPPEPVPVPPDRESDPKAKAIFEMLQKHRRQFVDSLPKKD